MFFPNALNNISHLHLSLEVTEYDQALRGGEIGTGLLGTNTRALFCAGQPGVRTSRPAARFLIRREWRGSRSGTPLLAMWPQGCYTVHPKITPTEQSCQCFQDAASATAVIAAAALRTGRNGWEQSTKRPSVGWGQIHHADGQETAGLFQVPAGWKRLKTTVVHIYRNSLTRVAHFTRIFPIYISVT